MKVRPEESAQVPRFEVRSNEVMATVDSGQTLVIAGFAQPSSNRSQATEREPVVLITPRLD